MKTTIKLYALLVMVPCLIAGCSKGEKSNPGSVEIQVTELTNNSELKYFGGNAITQFNGKLWLAGGDVLSSQNSNFIIFQSTNGVNWNNVSHNSDYTRRYAPSLTVFDDQLWLIGGLDHESNLFADINKSPDAESWISVISTAPFGGTALHHCFVHDNKMILVTGYQAGAVSHNTVWSTTDGTNWTEENSTAFPYRYGSSFVKFQNEYYIVGGTNGTGYFNEIYKSTDGVTWSSVSTSGSLFSGLAFHTTTVHNGKVWLVGGEGSGAPAPELWYSSDMIHWTEYIDLPSGAQAMKLHSAMDYNGKIWLFGGEYFDASENAWKLQGKIQTMEEL